MKTATKTTKRRKLAVRLCKDVLRQMRQYKRIEGGTYCDTDWNDFDAFEQLSTSADPVAVARRNCRVCALGTLFLEALRIDGVHFPGAADGVEDLKSSWDARSGIVSVLAPAFTGGQLTKIESAFEFSSFGNWPGPDGSRERLRAILKHVIANGGEFPGRTP